MLLLSLAFWFSNACELSLVLLSLRGLLIESLPGGGGGGADGLLTTKLLGYPKLNPPF